MKALLALLRSEPVAVQSALSALLALGASFGLRLTADQTGAVVAAVVVVLGLIARSQVTPTAPPVAPAPPVAAEGGQVTIRLLLSVAVIAAGLFVAIDGRASVDLFAAGLGLVVAGLALLT